VISGSGSAPATRPRGEDRYRADIDGLRAIAVLYVIAYHMGLRFSHGGYIGVDVFFVISGFLITSIIARDLDACRFTISGFYVRRIRRIFPALFAMLLLTTVAAYFLLWPEELKAYGTSLLAAVGSVSNFYFWNATGYFEAQHSTVPLLHTWSLAVEEQFYLIFPLLLGLLYRMRRNRHAFQVLSICAAASLAISAWAAYRHPAFAFYWPLSRAWELLLGSMLAIKRIPGMERPVVRNMAGLTGLGLILFSGIWYTDYTPFPGLAALAPCLGACLIIGAGGKTLVGLILSSPPMRFIGKISYSLYLWHWPVIVVAALALPSLSMPPQARLIAEGITALVVATLSWRFIEQPFRQAKTPIPSARVFRVAALCACAPVIAGLVFLLFDGIPSRFTPRAVSVASYITHGETAQRYRTGTCFLTSDYTFSAFRKDTCLHQTRGAENVLVFGDSHAAHLESGLTAVFPKVNFLQATAAGCKPVLWEPIRRPDECIQLVNYVLRDFLPSSNVKVVILGGHWRDGDDAEIEETVQRIQSLGMTPILMGPIPEYDSALPRLLALSIQTSHPELPGQHREQNLVALDRKLAFCPSTGGTSNTSPLPTPCAPMAGAGNTRRRSFLSRKTLPT
jgi:peptidoglycan/LPS O-acetylase OafA/YrhL